MLQTLLWIIFLLMVVILYKIHSMDKRISFLKEIFIYRSPFNGFENIVNIPQEISSLKELLSPLFFLPLRFAASQLINLKTRVDDEFDRQNKLLTQQKLSEMERFAQSGSPSEPFPASDSLKRTLREWAVALNKVGQVNRWKEEYTQLFVDIMSGKITIEQAEKSLAKIGVPSLVLDKNESGINELYDYEAEKWQAGKWFEELKLLRNSGSDKFGVE